MPTECEWLGGYPIIRRGERWVAVFGCEYAVHFSRLGSHWVAQHPDATDVICWADDLIECASLALRDYKRGTTEARASPRAAINGATRKSNGKS